MPGGAWSAATRSGVLRYVAALNSHDPDAVAACVREDFVNEHTSVGGRSLTGRDPYRAALAVFLDDFRELRYDVEDLAVEGSLAMLAYRMRFRTRPADGRWVDIRGVFRIRTDSAGLLTHRTDYWDSGQLERQLAEGET